MKRIVVILCCLLFLCACARSSGEYDRGYADGYAAAMSEYSRTIPDVTPAPTARAPATPRTTVTPKATYTPKPTAPASEDFTVYVSNSGTMHKKSNCSGMKYYTEMPYSVAKEYYTKKCSKCFK